MSDISKVDRSLLFRFAGRKDRRASVGSVIRLIWSVHYWMGQVPGGGAVGG